MTLIRSAVLAGLACAVAAPAFAADDADTRRRQAIERTQKQYGTAAPVAARRIQPGIDRSLVTNSVQSENPYDARGVVVPNAEVTISSGIAARIVEMPFREGDAFSKGAILVRYDCARPKADLRAAKASRAKATTYWNGKKRLLARGAAGRQEVREARADVDGAQANVDALAEVVNMCTVVAPFTGRVVEHHADRHEIPAANAPVLTVVDDSRLELDLIVPSKWLRWVSAGTRFEFAVDEVGTAFKARILRVGAKVDAVSQTVKLTGAFSQRPGNVLAGMSGTARFDPRFK